MDDKDTGCTYLPSEVQSAPNRVSLQGIVKYLAVDANRAMITNAIQPNETLPSHRVACLVRTTPSSSAPFNFLSPPPRAPLGPFSLAQELTCDDPIPSSRTYRTLVRAFLPLLRSLIDFRRKGEREREEGSLTVA